MKKILYAFLGLLPFTLLAAVAQILEVPKEASDIVNDLVKNTMPTTVVLSGSIMTIVQIIKRVLAAVRVDISGIKSQALVIILAVIYAAFNVNAWDDGILSQQDVVIIVQSILSAVGGIYSYKLIWRVPEIKDPSENSSENQTPKKEV